eukprot:scaffold35860_cov129-Isochrysis_galbana.AAC.2
MLGADKPDGIPRPAMPPAIPPRPNESAGAADGALAPVEANLFTSAKKESELWMVVPPSSTRTPGLAVFISATKRASSYVAPPTMKTRMSVGARRLVPADGSSAPKKGYCVSLSVPLSACSSSEASDFLVAASQDLLWNRSPVRQAAPQWDST